MENQDWDIPTGLTANGRKAAFAIRNFAKAHGLVDSGGGKMFFTPKEWNARGQKYCGNSDLVVDYEGAAIQVATSLDAAFYSGSYALHNELYGVLNEIGVYMEEGTLWYSGVYPQRNPLKKGGVS
jgi:hypothetical protein